jgi:predicted dehydrogenase
LLVEKPLAQSLEQAREVVQAADRAGVPMMVGHVVRFFPEFRRANQLVREGRVGKPAAIRMRRGGGPPKAEWFLDHSLSGGILVDLAVHDFDWLRWTFGEVSHLYARSVGARTGRGPDYALTTMTFESGAVAHVETTWMDPSGGRATLEVCGSDGMFQYDSRQAAILRTHTAGLSRAEAPLSLSDDPYRNQLAGFVAGLETGDMPVTGIDGFMALSLGLAARESAHSGRVVVPVRF